MHRRLCIVWGFKSSMFSTQRLERHRWSVLLFACSLFRCLGGIRRRRLAELVQPFFFPANIFFAPPPPSLPVPPSSGSSKIRYVSGKRVFPATSHCHHRPLPPFVNEEAAHPCDANEHGEEDEIVVNQTRCVDRSAIVLTRSSIGGTGHSGVRCCARHGARHLCIGERGREEEEKGHKLKRSARHLRHHNHSDRWSGDERGGRQITQVEDRACSVRQTKGKSLVGWRNVRIAEAQAEKDDIVSG